MSKEERVAKAHQIIGNIAQNLTDLVDIFMSDKYTEDHPAVENKKKRRDPNAPKLPTSNFFLFTNSIREEVERDNPDSTFAEKSKIYGARWQKLSEEERKPFNEKAKEEREKFNKEMAIYESEHTEDQSNKKTKIEPVPTKASTSSKPAKSIIATPAPVPAKASKATKTAPAPVPTKATKAAPTKAAKVTPTVKTAPTKPSKSAKPVVQESSSSDSDSDDSSSSDSDDSD